MIYTYDFKNLKEARINSLRSKDKTKIGALLVDRYNIPISDGWNHLPRTFTCEAVDTYLADRDLKNRFIVHAEVDCICRANIYNNHNQKSLTLYVWGLHSCARCAGFVSNFEEIDRVVSIDTVTTPNRSFWDEEAKIAQQIYKDAFIKVDHYEKNEFDSLINEYGELEEFYAN